MNIYGPLENFKSGSIDSILAKNDRYDLETTAQQSINSKIMVKGSYLEFYC